MASALAAKPSLLFIPPEIRDWIITLTLLSKRTVPNDITAAASTRAEKQPRIPDDFVCPKKHYWGHVKPARAGTTPNSLSLLLVNHQLSAETSSALARLYGADRRPSYSLDVMFVEERELWPTWTCVPVFAQHIDTLEVSFRICGARPQAGTQCRNPWVTGSSGIGVRPGIDWSFFYLFEHFARRGACARENGNQRASARVLVLDFVTPEGDMGVADNLYEWRMSRPWCSGDRPQQLVRPEWLADYLKDCFAPLLAMSYHTAKYGALLYECIGEMKISVDGVVRHEIDIGRALARLDHTGPADTFGHVRRERRMNEYREWKTRTTERRRELSFPLRIGEELGEGITD